MNTIVAVYADWGIGRDGTQPLALSADRKYFREMTKGHTVVVGRKTLADFPGGKPLPGRRNILLSRSGFAVPGVELAATPEEAVRLAGEEAFVIGGAQVYRALLPYCSRAYVTKLLVDPGSDVFFPNLDQDPAWRLLEESPMAEENGILYKFAVYVRKTQETVEK